MKTTIHTLFKQGHNKTQIGKMLGIDRKTVRKILKEPMQEKQEDEKKSSQWPSMLDEYKEYIEIQLAKELSITRIHQDLQKEYDITCGYSTLRDYVTKIRRTQPHAYMVLHSLPGEEAQVDFGYIGTLKVDGVSKKAWVFLMSLSYSRYMYAAITLDQSVQTFIRCHIAAFRYFNGVPETVKIDNLKAAIIEADFYEPTVQRTYASFAKHYGFLPDPCRVYTPTDKGKIEANIKYVKDNCFKGRDFTTLEAAQKFLSEWLATTANRRIHGTTKKIPEEIYEEQEKGRLKPLPVEEFVFSNSTTAMIRTDCHLVYRGNYYSAPYTHIGIEVTVIEINHLLKIYYEGKEIALHTLRENEIGEHVTDKSHYPSTKTITKEKIMDNYQEKMSAIGKGALDFFKAYKESDILVCRQLRSLAGILSLQKRYEDEVIDKACRRACYYGNLTYRAVKKICENGLYTLPMEDSQEQAEETKSNIRKLSDYQKMTGLGVIEHE